MNRLIKKNKYGEFEPIKHNEVCDKLGKLEDIEDELGCPLEVIFEAINNGIIDKKGKTRHASLSYGFIGGHKKEYYFAACDYDDTIILPLRNYKYDWWLVSDKENK